MVTRKTRLLSAFAAVLMLVSLFTCFVLPATAAEDRLISYAELSEINLNYDIVGDWPQDGLLPYKYRTADDTVKNYAITDAADWLAAVADSNAILKADGKAAGPLGITAIASCERFDGITLWFTNDIDFSNAPLDQDGDGTVEYGEVLFNTHSSYGFSGTLRGQGFAIKNLNLTVSYEAKTNYKAFGLICYGTAKKAVIRDLTFASGSFNVTNTAADEEEAYVGVFLGSGNGSVIANCWNNADLTFTDQSKTNCAISVFGRKAYGTVVNSFNTGTLYNNNPSARVTVLSDWKNDKSNELNIYNSFNYGTSTSHTTMGLVSTKGGSDYVTTVTLSNVINVGYPIAANSSNKATLDAMGTILEAGSEGGLLAFTLNKNYDTKYDTAYGRRYYTVADGKTVWGTAENQTVKVCLIYDGNEVGVGYVNMNESTDLSSFHDIAEASYAVDSAEFATFDGSSITVKKVPTTDLTVTVNLTSTALQYGDLDEVLAFYDGKNTNYYVDSEGNELTAVYNAIREEKENYNQDQIDAAVARLAKFSFNEEQLISVNEFETYNDVVKKISVASKEDMDHLAEIYTDLTKAQTIYITADIDMKGTESNPNSSLTGMTASIDGMNHTISNLYVTSAWLGNYGGTAIKNLTFANCTAAPTTTTQAFLIATVTGKTEISNVTLDHVTVNHGATGYGTYGLMIACLSGGDLTLKDISIVNSNFNRNDFKPKEGSTSEYCNSGMVLGKTYKGTLNVDGVYLNDNTITGTRTGGGAGVAFGEIICDSTVKNIVVLNTDVSDSQIKGVFASVKEGSPGDSNPADPEISIENVIAYNNGETTNCIVTNANEGKGTTIKNVYTDTTAIISAPHASITVTGGSASAANAITSGEAAYAVNVAGNKTLAMKKTGDVYLPVFAAEGATAAVTFKTLVGATVATLYTDADGKLIGLTDDIFNAYAWDGYETKADLEAAVFTADTTVQQAECNHNYQKVYNGNGTHTIICLTPDGCGSKVENEPCTYGYTISSNGLNHMKKCTVCEHEESEECDLSAVSTGSGKHTVSCSKCSYSAEEDCDYAETYVPHTNITRGYTHYECICGSAYDVYDAEMKHSWSDTATTVKEPTYGEAGSAKVECDVCDACKYIELGALPGTGIIVNAPQSAQSGESIDVTLEIAENPGIAGLNFEVLYDTDVLTLNTITDGGLYDYFKSVKNDDVANANGVVPMAFLKATNVTDTDGKVLVTLNFTVKEGATLGISAIDVKIENTGASDEKGKYVAVGDGKAVIEIVNYGWGDANIDGITDLRDVQAILKWRVGELSDNEINMAAADADRDGKVSLADALLLLQWQADLVEWDPFGWTQEPIA